MSAIADFLMWAGIWSAAGAVVGAFGMWATMARNVDSRAHDMAQAAYGARTSPEDWDAGETQHVVRPVQVRQMDGD